MLEEGLDVVKVPIDSNLSRRRKTPQISCNLSTKRASFSLILLSPLFDLKVDYFRRRHFQKWLSQAFHPLTRFQASAKNQQEFDTHVCVLTVKLSPHNHLLQLNGSKTPHYWALYVDQPIVGGKDFSSVKRDLSAWNWLEKLRSVSLNTLKAPDCQSVKFFVFTMKLTSFGWAHCQ